MITTDEVSYAGGLWNGNNSNGYYYLNSSGGSSTGSNYWWTMSPSFSRGTQAVVLSVGGSSVFDALDDAYVYVSYVIRPVISLKKEVLVTGGSGTGNDPYIVSMP